MRLHENFFSADINLVANEHVPQLGQLIQLVVAELGAQGGDAAVACHRHRAAAVLHRHRAELVALEQLAATTYPLLDKECRTARHLDFDQNGHDDQDGPQEKETEEGDDAVKKKLQYHDVLSVRERQRENTHQRAPAVAAMQGDEAPKEIEEIQFLHDGQFGTDATQSQQIDQQHKGREQ